MPKFSLLVLDAGVVIKLFELRLWDQVVKQCDVHLSKVVAEQEVQFHSPTDADPHGQPIDLSGDIAESRVQVFECSLSQVVSLQEILDRIGHSKNLAWQYTKEFREQKSKAGSVDRLQDRGLH